MGATVGVVGGVASIGSGIMGAVSGGKSGSSSSSSKNSSSQSETTGQRGVVNQWLTDYANAGTNVGLPGWQAKLQAGPGEYEQSDYYNFLAGEGSKGIERSAAAKGKLLSGQTLKALGTWNQNVAGQGRKDWLAEYYANLGEYEKLAKTGAAAAGGLSQINTSEVKNTTGSETATGTGTQDSGTDWNALAKGVESGIGDFSGAYNSYNSNALSDYWKKYYGGGS
jgi:hypothetical protein